MCGFVCLNEWVLLGRKGRLARTKPRLSDVAFNFDFLFFPVEVF